jgi:hypothetical protein
METLNIKSTLLGKDKKDNWESYKWNIELSGKNSESVHVDYYTGIGLVDEFGKPKTPNIEDVIFSLISDLDAGNNTFEDFCFNYGYDEDSIKALDIYRECQKSGKKIFQLLSREQIADVRIKLENY